MSEESVPIHEARQWIRNLRYIDLPPSVVYAQGNGLKRWRNWEAAQEIEQAVIAELGVVGSEVSGAGHWWLARDAAGRITFAAVCWYHGNMRLYENVEILYDWRMKGKFSPWYTWKPGTPLPDGWVSAYD